MGSMAWLGVAACVALSCADGAPPPTVPAAPDVDASAPPAAPAAPDAGVATSPTSARRVVGVDVSAKGSRLVASGGACVEITRAGRDDVSAFTEKHVRCIGAERVRALLADVDRALGSAALSEVEPGASTKSDGARVTLDPGGARAVTAPDAVSAVAKVVETFRSTLLSERPRAGQPIAGGWTSLRAMGPAVLAGRRDGVLDLEITSGGGYACEIVSRDDQGASRETQAGEVAPDVAAALLGRALTGAAPSTKPPGPVTVRALKGEAATVLAPASTTTALDAIATFLTKAGGACAAELRRGAETPLDEAKRAAAANKHAEVRRLLTPRVLEGKGKGDAAEVTLLRAACEALKDSKCLIRLKEKHP
jgi:hypothetical protein